MKLSHLLGFTAGLIATSQGLGCGSNAESAATNESAVTGVPIGDVRGIVDVTKTMRSRLFDEADVQTPNFDVSRVAGPVFRLRKQLGVFALEGTSSTYLGGTPTPLRATLWHQVMGRFATAVGDMCAIDPAVTPSNTITFVAYASGPTGGLVAPSTFSFRRDVAGVVTTACSFGGAEDERREAAGALFDTFMGLGGTLAADRASFVTEFAADGAPAVKAAPKERVTNMVLAMLLNPHFLLAK